MSDIERAKAPEQGDVHASIRDLRLRIERLERREWWMWWASVIVMLLLTTAVVTLSLPNIMGQSEWLARMQMDVAVRALVGMVLLFNTYTIYQFFLIRKLRTSLTDQIAKTNELETRAEALYQLAVEDGLTGLFNRRYADERLATEVARSRRHGRQFTVMLLDLDDFKEINDTYGHAAGDLVLEQFSERLKKCIRTSDLAARVGGDEFMVLLLECAPPEAQRFLNRLQPFEAQVGDRKMTMNVSAGWAGFEPEDTRDSLMDRADRALYENKRTGKTPEAAANGKASPEKKTVGSLVDRPSDTLSR